MLQESLNVFLGKIGTWIDPANAQARETFAFAMRDKTYGIKETIDAWDNFLSGWKLAETSEDRRTGVGE